MGCAASRSPCGLGLRLAGPLRDDAEDAVRRLLYRQFGDVDDRAAEPAVELLRLLELLVDLGELRVLPVAPGSAHGPHTRAPDLDEPVRMDRETDHLGLVDL